MSQKSSRMSRKSTDQLRLQSDSLRNRSRTPTGIVKNRHRTPSASPSRSISRAASLAPSSTHSRSSSAPRGHALARALTYPLPSHIPDHPWSEQEENDCLCLWLGGDGYSMLVESLERFNHLARSVQSVIEKLGEMEAWDLARFERAIPTIKVLCNKKCPNTTAWKTSALAWLQELLYTTRANYQAHSASHDGAPSFKGPLFGINDEVTSLPIRSKTPKPAAPALPTHTEVVSESLHGYRSTVAAPTEQVMPFAKIGQHIRPRPSRSASSYIPHMSSMAQPMTAYNMPQPPTTVVQSIEAVPPEPHIPLFDAALEQFLTPSFDLSIPTDKSLFAWSHMTDFVTDPYPGTIPLYGSYSLGGSFGNYSSTSLGYFP